MLATVIATRRCSAPAFGPQPAADPQRQRELLAEIASSQNTDAFVALFNHFAPRLKAYMRRLGAGDMQAEELVQDVMVTVWRKADSYDPAKSAVSSWIFTIARNLRIDAARRDRRHALDPNDPQLVPDALPLPDAEVQSEERDRRIRAALATLPREQRTVVGLAFYDGKSHAEIASKLALPLGTVKSRMRLAFLHLRAALGELEGRTASEARAAA